uniref:Uncharacterized protein n=1 Tax=Glossina pallidipes TaxID=7398 RepID=A0A1A9Z687_GLOPL
MHYHMGAGGSGAASSTTSGASGLSMPTYLFGEHYYGSGFPSAVGPRKCAGPSSKEEIYLNKSGWVQVNTKRVNDENRSYRRGTYAHQNGDMRNTIRVVQIDNTRRSDAFARQTRLQHQHSMAEMPKFMVSKVEELIQRNEARLGNCNIRDSTLRPGYRIVDPQLASILNDRPGFLPVKNHDNDSPPPITPILSPPPAFQDTKSKHSDRRRAVSGRSPAIVTPHYLTTSNNLQAQSVNGGVAGKGMVFSRSFEYDTRRPPPTDAYVNTFSRSFDGNLTERLPPPLPRRDRSPNFSTLTGNSPNYLTKKDSGGGSSGSLRSRDSSPKYQSPAASVSSSMQSPQTQKTTAYLNTSVKEAPPSYSVAGHVANNSTHKYSPRSSYHERAFERSKSQNIPLGRSRKSQFSRTSSGGLGVNQVNNITTSRFRSFDTTVSQRLNSCDSGARSDLSNDELEIENDDAGSTEFLNTNNYLPSSTLSPFKPQRQRSLTPDRNESHSSSSSLRKQRSLTPESRSLTPEDRRKKGSQISLIGSRQNSSSRSNTLERKHDKLNVSRSSSSSSYSGREGHEGHGYGSGVAVNVTTITQHRRSTARNAKQSDEHRIRRSRSLQLTERSPNRGHKMIVCVGGQTHTTSNSGPTYQQTNIRGKVANNFPPTIRATGKSQSILLSATNGGNTRLRQNDIDKSRSFDFDYCNYNSPNNTVRSHHSNSSLLGSAAGLLNREASLRLDFDKSHSFDEDYHDALTSNNNLNAAAMRYLQAIDGNGTAGVRLRRTSPVEGGRNNRSPQSSGSSCNNLSVPRSSTSPQNYGTRLCDHEMTFDLLRKSLDRSPIMDFRRNENAASGDYDFPVSQARNRETIKSGGNSELNFLNADSRLYEHSLKQQRSLRRTHSPNETHSCTHASRNDVTPPEISDYRSDYTQIYNRNRDAVQRTNNRGSQLSSTTNIEQSHLSCLPQCSFWPQCGDCQDYQEEPNQQSYQYSFENGDYFKSLPIKRQNSLQYPRITCETENHNFSVKEQHSLPSSNSCHVSTVKVNVNIMKLETDGFRSNSGSRNSSCINADVNTFSTNVNNEAGTSFSTLSMPLTNRSKGPLWRSNSCNSSQWTLLCSGIAAITTNTDISTTSITTTTNTKTTTTITTSTTLTSLTYKTELNNTMVNVKMPTTSTPSLSLFTSYSSTVATNTIPTITSSTSLLSTAFSIPSSLSSPSSSSPSSSSSSLSSPMSTNVLNCSVPRVIPLTATSLVHLGNCEIPVSCDPDCGKFTVKQLASDDSIKNTKIVSARDGFKRFNSDSKKSTIPESNNNSSFYEDSKHLKSLSLPDLKLAQRR